jgi:O-glycosyl hydrolase
MPQQNSDVDRQDAGSKTAFRPRSAAMAKSRRVRKQSRRAPGRPVANLEGLESRMLLSAAVMNWNDVRQTIDGFGASSAWASGTINATALAQIFSPATGAGLSLFRSRVTPYVGSTEYQMMQQVGAYGVRTWSTPWTPPREFKTNHDNNNGGTLDPAHYQDYANDLADYVQNITRQGIPLYALSIQNEPNWTADYESCRWDAAQFAAFLPYLGQTFAARGMTTKIMLPEQLNWDFSLASTIMANPTLSQYVGILAAHNYGEGANTWKPYTGAGGRSVWETEISSFATGGELGTAIDTADDIYQAMSLGNANAYHYWWLSSSGASALTNNWVPTKRLWAMGQYSKFVRPGWVRIGETDDGGLDITTFKDPQSGKFAIVVVNKSTSNSVTETFTLSGVTAGSVTPYVTSAADNLTAYAPISLTGGTSFAATIGASSIVTYYGTSDSAAPVQAPGNLYAAPLYGNPASQIALSWADNSSAETGYTVERSTDGTNWAVATSSLAANTTSFTDTGRVENTLYYYRVKPTNGDATTYSAVVSAATILQTPTSLSGSRTASGINLSWNFPNATATGVTIDRSLDGVTWTTIAKLASRATSYSDTIPGYNAGQIYFYRVRATAAGKTSAYAAWNTGLAAPTNFTVAGVTTSSVTLTWTAPLGASGIRVQANGSTVSPSSLQATAGTYTITGLSSGTSYSFRLQATSAADSVSSAYTSTLNATTTAPSPNPVVWYKADESGGGTLADSSGNGKTGTLTGSYGFTTGVTSNAVNLTGGYASLPAGIVSSLGDFTIATWIRPSTIDQWSRVFDFGTGTSSYMFFTPQSSSGMPRFTFTTGGSTQSIDSTVALAANTWAHVAITVSGNTGTLYINGAVAGTNTGMSYHPSNLGATTQDYLGKSQYSWDPTFKGAIDDFRIYERALSASEIGTIANTAPTVAIPAAASPATVNGTTTLLSVLGADRAGESGLTYTWSATGSPPAPVTCSANGTHAARQTTATFAQAGSYTLSVAITNALGLTTNSAVNVTVNQTLTGATISPAAYTVAPGGSTQLGVYGADQFGDAMATLLGGVTWSVYSGAGAMDADGLFTAPIGGSGITTVRAVTSGGQVLYANVLLLNQTAWYPADAASGTALADASGNNRNATLSGAAAFGPGLVGNALNLSGGYASLPTGIVSTLNDFTLAAWVKLDSISTWSRIFDFGTGTTVNMFLTPRATSTTGPVRFAITTSGNGGEQQISGTTALATGSWQHVAVTLSGNTGTLYLNGVVVGTNTNMTLHPSSLGATTQNYLGDSQYSNDPALLGRVDDFRIVGRALSAAEIQQLLNPAIVTAASASDLTATSATLSVVGADALGGESSLSYTWSVLGTPPAPVTFSNNGSHAARTTTAAFTAAGTYDFQVTATNQAGYAVTSTTSATIHSEVIARQLFYGGSVFDAGAHDNALAWDKSALLPGFTASLANYSSYDRGINGIMLDIASPAGALSPFDFVLRVGNDDAPSAWALAPAPLAVVSRPGAGINGSTRVEITWADGAIAGEWVQITLLGGDGSTSGLAADDVFYFGNAIGEAGNDPASARVTTLDELSARSHPTAFASIVNSCDYNRDGTVDVADQLVARTHGTCFINELRLIAAPALGGGDAASMAVGGMPLTASVITGSPAAPADATAGAPAEAVSATPSAVPRVSPGSTLARLPAILVTVPLGPPSLLPIGTLSIRRLVVSRGLPGAARGIAFWKVPSLPDLAIQNRLRIVL